MSTQCAISIPTEDFQHLAATNSEIQWHPQKQRTERWAYLDSMDGLLQAKQLIAIQKNGHFWLGKLNKIPTSKQWIRQRQFTVANQCRYQPWRQKLDKALGLRALKTHKAIDWNATDWLVITDSGDKLAEVTSYQSSNDKPLVVMALTIEKGAKNQLFKSLSNARQLSNDDIYLPAITYQPKPELAMQYSDSGRAVINRFGDALLNVVDTNFDEVINDLDIECLHEYRVALRRFRSLLPLTKSFYTEGEYIHAANALKALMAPTGETRDLDVFLTTQPQMLGALPSTLQPGVNAFYAWLAKRRQQAFRRLTRQMRQPSYRANIDTLRQLCLATHSASIAGPIAIRALSKKYAKARKLINGLGPSSHEEAIHQARIACKKLRYALEFATPLLTRPYDLIKPLKDIQESLGAFNDVCVQRQFMLDSLEQYHGKEPTVYAVIGAMLLKQEQRISIEKASILDELRQLTKEKVSQRYQHPEVK